MRKKKSSNLLGIIVVLLLAGGGVYVLYLVNSKKQVDQPVTPMAVTNGVAGQEAEQAPTTPRVAVPTEPPVMVVFRPDTEAPLGTRLLTDDKPESRFGPGVQYPFVSDASFQRGQRVYVMDERDSWIRIRLNESPGPGAGWIHKFASMPEMHLSKDTELFGLEVEELKRAGLLIDLRVQDNEALIETNQWAKLPIGVKRGVGRSLAFYCGLKRGVNTRWVDLSDSVSGVRLARYSDNTDYSEYSTLRKPKK